MPWMSLRHPRRVDSIPCSVEIEALDVTDKVAVQDAIARHRPTHVVHLAGFAAPSAADADPQNTWRVHVQGTLNVASAILDHAPECWLIHVGSGLVYGESARSGLPLDENTLLAPIDDYGVTKAAADLALGALSRRGLKCIRLRPFNHTGPGQTEAFVVPAFAMQIAQIEAGLAQPIIRVGNLDAERDFLDVRDVAEAYALVAKKSVTIWHPGRSSTSASGAAHQWRCIGRTPLTSAAFKIKVEQDSARMRPSDLPRIMGNAEKARHCLAGHLRDPYRATLPMSG